MKTPQIINSKEILLRYIPNTLSVVAGESEIYDKILPNIISAENWVASTFVDLDLFAELEPESQEYQVIENLIVCVALRSAIPSLDLVLTPNGFGVVNTSSIAPASKERVNRYVASLEEQRDSLIEILLPLLLLNENWVNSNIGKWFSSTLFADFSILNALGIASNKWVNYLGVRSRILFLESRIAELFISEEYMAELRQVNIESSTLATPDNIIRMRLRTFIMSALRRQISDIPDGSDSLLEIVNFIRTFPDDYPTWHASNLARYFNPSIFQNKKESHGYFF